MKNEPIYVITVMKSKDYFEKFRDRVVGFYHEFENAKDAVLANSMDMYENEYDIAVIEETFPGEYYLSRTRWWFKYIPETEKYIMIDEPEEFASVVNFGIG